MRTRGGHLAATRGGGTRGGVGRLAAMAIGLIVLLALVCADGARAGTYRVARCGWGVGAELAPVEAYFWSGSVTDSCGLPDGGVRFEVFPAANGADSIARTTWTAPPGTAFTAVRAIWSGAMQPIIVLQVGIEEAAGWRPLATVGGASVPTQAVAVGVPAPGDAVEFRLDCILEVRICLSPYPSRATVREVTLTLSDPAAPVVSLGGDVPGDGWHRGTVGLDLSAEDAGAGVAQLQATVDGAALAASPVSCATATIEGELRATAMRPCPTAAGGHLDVDTTRVADGRHGLAACAVDFAGNTGCAPAPALDVDNTPPALDFAAAADGAVAVAVRDPLSGPASGSIAVRRADAGDWQELPTDLRRTGPGEATLRAALPSFAAGTYVFRATATDVAGNANVATLVVGGSAGEIRQQVSEGRARGGKGGGGGRRSAGAHGSGRSPHLVAYLRAGPGGGLRGSRRLTVPFGAAVEVRGRLTGPGGRGLAGVPLWLAVHPVHGARVPDAVRRLTTDSDGRFASPLPAGPSRHVVVSVPAGGGLAPVRHRPLDLRVRAGVSLRAEPTTLHTGDTVALSGRVRRGPARFGGRGKLVAIQYLERSSGRWRPALVVRTDERGRFDTRYRFRYVTGLARIRLRATAPAEGGWPYARGSSAPVTVEVRGR